MPKSFIWFTTVLLFCLGLAHADHVPRSGGAFPSLGFKMPSSVPSSLNGWWTDPSTDVAFLGFSYSVTPCQSANTLIAEFTNMRKNYNARYVRLHGACDQDGFYDNVVNAAWNAGLGVHALIWFDSPSNNKWQTRRDSLFSTLHSNPKAKFVTRAVQFGSQPLTYHALSAQDLAAQVKAAQQNLSSLQIPVTVSETANGYQTNDGVQSVPITATVSSPVGGTQAQSVLDAIDFVDLAMLPYNNASATTAEQSWPFIENDLKWIIARVKGKKIILSENGWPQVAPGSTGPAPPHAVASLQQMEAYFNLLEFVCPGLKGYPGGGVGWFSHVYSISQDLSYGILDQNGKTRFNFNPVTSC